MLPLKTEKRVLTWLCIYPPAEKTGTLERIIYEIFSLTVVLAIACNPIASAAYVRKYLAIDPEEAVDGLHPIIGWTPLVLIFITMRILKLRVVAIFEALSEIYNKRKLLEATSKPLRIMYTQ